MAGMQDMTTHEYFAIKLEVVWNTVYEDLSCVRPKPQEICKKFPDEDT